MFTNEKKLILKIKNGNQRAFKQLYDTYSGYALRTAYGITKNNQHTADIVQETFIKVYRNIDRFDAEKPFKPWFYQILVNESRRYMKKQNKQAISVESEQLLDFLNEQETREKRNDHVESALELLSERHRTVLFLKYVNEFTEREIADLMDLNVNTIKSRLYKARQSLKEILGGDDIAK